MRTIIFFIVVVGVVTISSFAPYWTENENQICRVTLVDLIFETETCYDKRVEFEFKG